MILIIDIGSSSVRAILFDEDMQPHAQAQRKHQLTTDPPGAAIFDVPSMQDRVEACVDEILTHDVSIQAVGMASFVGNVLGLDSNGQPITPIYTYADSRSASAVAELREQVDVEAAHQRTGCLLHTAYLPGRLAWLDRDEVALWLDIATYLYREWFGQTRTSYSVASWSGLLNRATCAWDDDWLEQLGLSPENFPPLTDYDDAMRGLSDEYAARWPALRDVPFMLAVGDGAAANIGSGAVDASYLALTLGTTAALRRISSEKLPTVPAGLWSYRVTKHQHLIGGATSEGGNIFAWLRDTLRDIPDITGRPADAHGLTFLPLLAGERSPGWATHATGAMVGLRLGTNPADIVQAALEGVALRLALIAEQLAVTDEIQIMASGGALKSSRVWAQIIANALNAPLQMTAESEITARGVAILVQQALGQPADFPPTVVEIITPQTDAVEALAAARERHLKLYQQLIVV